jgi:hypothetical protein
MRELHKSYTTAQVVTLHKHSLKYDLFGAEHMFHELENMCFQRDEATKKGDEKLCSHTKRKCLSLAPDKNCGCGSDFSSTYYIASQKS